MDAHHFLTNTIVYLTAAVIAVPLFKRLGLGAVLGYLVAGIVIGPWGLDLGGDVTTMLHFAEFGVVLLLFVIGLELQPSRLKIFRKKILSSGTMQMGLTTLVLMLILMLVFELSLLVSLVIAFSLALSSTAFALQTLAEKKQLTTSYGREAFAILLFQDLAVIPALAVIPILSGDSSGTLMQGLIQVGLTTGTIIGVIVAGQYLVIPLLGQVARADTREVFTAATLLLVFGAAALFDSLGLSMALGAFLAGVLLAESEYRHALEADIEPFKGLLLGLFFIAVGMSVNLGLLFNQALLITGLALGLLLIKFGVLRFVAMRAKLPNDSPTRLGLIMPQGGEFAFVILGVAVTAGVISQELSEISIVVVTVSMFLSPLLYIGYETIAARSVTLPEPDVIDAEENHVIIAGFGPFGQIVARVLAVEKIPFTALEKNPEQVDFVRKYGNKIYYGDASRLDLLHAANAGEARAIILAIDDPEESMKTAKMIRKNFPELPILARARDRRHAFRLMDLGIKTVIRETLDSSLHMTKDLLMTLNYEETDAIRAVDMFAEHDAALLIKQHAIHHDEQALVQSTVEAREELRRLFDADKQKKP